MIRYEYINHLVKFYLLKKLFHLIISPFSLFGNTNFFSFYWKLIVQIGLFAFDRFRVLQRVHSSVEVGVQIAPEERILPALSCILLGLLLSPSAITSSGVPSFPEDAFFRSFPYLRDLVSRDRLLRIPFSGRVMSSNVPASVPPSAGFSLRWFFSRRSRFVIIDGR
jgi:hypothetical protein